VISVLISHNNIFCFLWYYYIVLFFYSLSMPPTYWVIYSNLADYCMVDRKWMPFHVSHYLGPSAHSWAFSFFIPYGLNYSPLFRCVTSDVLLSTGYFRRVTFDMLLSTCYFRHVTFDVLLSTCYFRRVTSDVLLPTCYFLLKYHSN